MYSVPHLKNGIFSMPERKPTRTADLDYFYGQSSELFSFYRIPKLLFQDSCFQPLSTDAKTLYGILLDRMSLSARNGWLDKAGRVFIILSLYQPMKASVFMKIAPTRSLRFKKAGSHCHPYGNGITNNIIRSINRCLLSKPDAEKILSSRCNLSILR
jgi:hypothetical protein